MSQQKEWSDELRVQVREILASIRHSCRMVGEIVRLDFHRFPELSGALEKFSDHRKLPGIPNTLARKLERRNRQLGDVEKGANDSANNLTILVIGDGKKNGVRDEVSDLISCRSNSFEVANAHLPKCVVESESVLCSHSQHNPISSNQTVVHNFPMSTSAMSCSGEESRCKGNASMVEPQPRKKLRRYRGTEVQPWLVSSSSTDEELTTQISQSGGSEREETLAVEAIGSRTGNQGNIPWNFVDATGVGIANKPGSWNCGMFIGDEDEDKYRHRNSPQYREMYRSPLCERSKLETLQSAIAGHMKAIVGRILADHHFAAFAAAFKRPEEPHVGDMESRAACSFPSSARKQSRGKACEAPGTPPAVRVLEPRLYAGGKKERGHGLERCDWKNVYTRNSPSTPAFTNHSRETPAGTSNDSLGLSLVERPNQQHSKLGSSGRRRQHKTELLTSAVYNSRSADVKLSMAGLSSWWRLDASLNDAMAQLLQWRHGRIERSGRGRRRNSTYSFPSSSSWELNAGGVVVQPDTALIPLHMSALTSLWYGYNHKRDVHLSRICVHPSREWQMDAIVSVKPWDVLYCHLGTPNGQLSWSAATGAAARLFSCALGGVLQVNGNSADRRLSLGYQRKLQVCETSIHPVVSFPGGILSLEVEHPLLFSGKMGLIRNTQLTTRLRQTVNGRGKGTAIEVDYKPTDLVKLSCGYSIGRQSTVSATVAFGKTKKLSGGDGRAKIGPSIKIRIETPTNNLQRATWTVEFSKLWKV